MIWHRMANLELKERTDGNGVKKIQGVAIYGPTI